MSSRRGAGEENILALLERDSARRNGSRMAGVRLAWYGAAAALAGVLAGGIAWLAWDNHKGVQELQARHDAVVAPPAMSGTVAPPQAAPAIEAPRAAVIIDESARKRDTMVAGGVPPLVMLPPQEVSSAAEKKPEKTVRPVPRPAKPARAAGLVKARSEPAARARRAAPGAEAPVDSDVALISAIIQQSERHRGDGQAAGCRGARCPPRSSHP